MPLDEAQRRKAAAKLDGKFECPRCGRTNEYEADLTAFPLGGV